MSSDSQIQNEALVRLMLAARYQDKKITLSENESFTKQLEALPWSSGTALSVFVNQATATVREALSSEGTRQKFLEAQSAPFKDSKAKLNAVHAIEAVLSADGIDPKESTFLQQLRAILKI